MVKLYINNELIFNWVIKKKNKKKKIRTIWSTYCLDSGTIGSNSP